MALSLIVFSCSSDNRGDEPWPPVTPTPEPPPAVAPDFDSEIHPFDPTVRATDTYTPGDDNDIYWEANDFTATVEITYNGAEATVTSSDASIKSVVSDADVAIDITSDVKTRITVRGSSTDGSLKIYSIAKILLDLDGVSLTSAKGPAVNVQSKKRLFVVSREGSVNSFADCREYAAADHYYQIGSSAAVEDRKGAFFAEGHIVVSGKGLLQVFGHNRHALATDGSLRVLPGSSLDIECDSRNAIHAKGSSKEGRGVTVEGGYIYALCTGEAGKCIKSDLDIVVMSGELSLNNTAAAIFDTSDNTTSSGAGIKSDTNVTVNGGTIGIHLTGDGAKGIAADLNLTITDADMTITSTGKQFVHSQLTSSPSGLKADNIITISGGSVNIGMFGDDPESDAIDAKGELRIGGGQTYCYAFGNGLCSQSSLRIAGGYVYALSRQSEAITSPSSIAVTGGYVIAHSSVASSSQNAVLTVYNATVIAAGGSSMTTVDTAKSRSCHRFASVTLKGGEPFAVASESGSPLFAARFLAPLEEVPLLIASPKFTAGSTWVLFTGGSLQNPDAAWNGFVDGGTLTGDVTSTPFSIG